MRQKWWSRGFWMFTLALPVGVGLVAFGEVAFIRGLGTFVLADAAAGAALCAVALRVLYPRQWRSELRRLSEKARGAHHSAERLATSAATPPQSAALG